MMRKDFGWGGLSALRREYSGIDDGGTRRVLVASGQAEHSGVRIRQGLIDTLQQIAYLPLLLDVGFAF